MANLSGKLFGRLTALEPTSERCGGSIVWRCRCTCGCLHKVPAKHLTTGGIQSCGCLLRDILRERGPQFRTHGKSGSPEYRSWRAMLNRCSNPKAGRNWKEYGARGIKVCPQWRKSFFQFYRDMGPRPTGKTLDRINTNGNYTPKNCRWATLSEQQKNKRQFGFKLNAKKVREIRALRSTHTLKALAAMYKVDQSLISMICLRKAWAKV